MQNINTLITKKIVGNIQNKLTINSIELFSANWVCNIQKPSFVRFGETVMFLNRGFNLFGVKDNNLSFLTSYDSCVEDYAADIQKYTKNIYDKNEYDYIIFITHDDAVNKTNVNILQNYLIFLGCTELKKLIFRASYLFVYDLRKKQILFELCDNKFPIHEWFELTKDNDNQYSLQNLGIPVYLIVYNFLYFSKNSVDQLKKYTKNIHIIDNKSTYGKLIDYYNNEYEFFLDKMEINHGHTVWLKHLYWQFPRYFVISDPDLEYNKNLPLDFLNILKNLSNHHKKGKVGFALDLSDSNLFYQEKNYTEGVSIYEWERRFWLRKIDDPNYELYDAGLDTTFCLVNKEFPEKNNAIRVAGDFTCKHIPWYEGWNKRLDKDEWEFYKKNNISSSTLKMMTIMHYTTNAQINTLLDDMNSITCKLNDIVTNLDQTKTTTYFDVSKINNNLFSCINLLDDNKKILYDLIRTNKDKL